MRTTKAKYAEQLVVNTAGREQLELIARSQRLPAALARRAQMILRMADGESNTAVAQRFGVSRPTVTLWRARFRERGIEGLQNENKPGRPRRTREEQIAGLIATALGSKPQGKAYWSRRDLAAHAGLSKTTVHRYLSMLGVQPSRDSERPRSDRLRAIAGLYLNPPDHVLAICSYRDSALEAETSAAALLAALERANAGVLARYSPEHSRRQLLTFLQRIDAQVPQDVDVELICAYELAPPRSRTQAWLTRRPRFRMCCVATHGAWLSRVERELAGCSAPMIGPGFFDSVAAMKGRIARFSEHYRQHPQPFSWPALAEGLGGSR